CHCHLGAGFGGAFTGGLGSGRAAQHSPFLHLQSTQSPPHLHAFCAPRSSGAGVGAGFSSANAEYTASAVPSDLACSVSATMPPIPTSASTQPSQAMSPFTSPPLSVFNQRFTASIHRTRHACVIDVVRVTLIVRRVRP